MPKTVNWTQFGSMALAVLVIGTGVLGNYSGWFSSSADGMALITVGLSILGIHIGGVANPTP